MNFTDAHIEARKLFKKLNVFTYTEVCKIAKISPATLQLHQEKNELPQSTFSHLRYSLYTKDQLDQICLWCEQNLKRRKKTKN